MNTECANQVIVKFAHNQLARRPSNDACRLTLTGKNFLIVSLYTCQICNHKKKTAVVKATNSNKPTKQQVFDKAKRNKNIVPLSLEKAELSPTVAQGSHPPNY
jgi:hypothetical protein